MCIFIVVHARSITKCIDYGKTNETNRGEGSSLMRHIYKRFFSKTYEIKLKKERTSEKCPEFVKKNPKRPILRGKIGKT
jgi:hypothetical protein